MINLTKQCDMYCAKHGIQYLYKAEIAQMCIYFMLFILTLCFFQQSASTKLTTNISSHLIKRSSTTSLYWRLAHQDFVTDVWYTQTLLTDSQTFPDRCSTYQTPTDRRPTPFHRCSTPSDRLHLHHTQPLFPDVQHT